jgi:hypothetical protein
MSGRVRRNSQDLCTATKKIRSRHFFVAITLHVAVTLRRDEAWTLNRVSIADGRRHSSGGARLLQSLVTTERDGYVERDGYERPLYNAPELGTFSPIKRCCHARLARW